MKPCTYVMSGLRVMLLVVPLLLASESPILAEDNPPAPARSLVLVDIALLQDKAAEANLYDPVTNKKIRLRLADGADSFQFQNAEGKAIASARVVYLGERDLVLRTGDHYYAVHIGQTLAEALRVPLSSERVKALKLPPPRDREAEMRDLKAEIKAIRQRLSEIEKRLSELEKSTPE